MSTTPPPIGPDGRPLVPPPVDPVVVPPAETTVIREERSLADGAVEGASEVDVDVVHEEERVSMLADGSVLRETDRIEQRSTFRDRLPWFLLALVGVILAIGVVVWLVTRSSSKTVPAVVGLRLDTAVTRLQQDGFKAVIVRQSNAKAAGVVFGQNPAAETKHDDGSSVRLLVSQGPSRATIANAVGLTQSAARDRLVNAGFKVTTAEVFSDQPKGTVVAQAPAAGSHVAPGTLVRMNVSKGSATVDVPSEVGNTVTQARSDLAAKGLKPVVMQVPSTQPIDTVVAQAPAGGQVRTGSTVNLNVSKGAPASTTTASTPTQTATTTQTSTTVQTATTTQTATVTVPTTETQTVTTPSSTTTP